MAFRSRSVALPAGGADRSGLICCLVLCFSLQSEAPCLSPGCCVDLMPQLKGIVASKYEE